MTGATSHLGVMIAMSAGGGVPERTGFRGVTMEVHKLCGFQRDGETSQHFFHRVRKTTGRKGLGFQHREPTAAIWNRIQLPRDVLVDGLNLGQSFDDERADGALFGLAHPTEGQMVGVSVEREGRAKCVIFALERVPQESITFKVERRLEALCFRKSLRQEEDDGVIVRGVQLRAIRVLVLDRYRGQLIELSSLPVFTSVGC
jgi:hypothetical protein